MKTKDLIGPALNWAVAKLEVGNDCRDGKPCYYLHPNNPNLVCRVTYNHEENPKGYDLCRYSTDWSQGGPIIERLIAARCKLYLDNNDWPVCFDQGTNKGYCGPTTLIAAMRCYVASKMGDEVEIPEELK